MGLRSRLRGCERRSRPDDPEFAATPAPLLAGTPLRHGVGPLTVVMHRFMDAADVAPAWELTQRGVTSDDPRLRETRERLGVAPPMPRVRR